MHGALACHSALLPAVACSLRSPARCGRLLPAVACSLRSPALTGALDEPRHHAGHLNPETARGIAEEMKVAAGKAVGKVEKAAEEEVSVLVAAHGPSLWRLTLAGHEQAAHADVSLAHFEKLASLYAKHGGDGGGGGSGGGGGDGGGSGSTAHLADLRVRLFCTLMRYQSLGGHGSQCAVPPACFDVLKERLHVAMECFASPMNTRQVECAFLERSSVLLPSNAHPLP